MMQLMQLMRPTISLLRSPLASSSGTLSGLERSSGGAGATSAAGVSEVLPHLLGWPITPGDDVEACL